MLVRSLLARIQPTLALLLLAVCHGGCSPSPEGARPNILLVVMDTMRTDVLSVYGQEKPTSPNLERLAHESVLYTKVFSTNFWTVPAHASLFTGQYPSDHQATSETHHLPQTVTTLAERLSSEGYRTAAFVSNPWLSQDRGFAQGFSTFDPVWRDEEGHTSSINLDRDVIRRALQWIDAVPSQGKPYFVFVNLNNNHMPYDPDPLVLAELSPTPRSVERSARLRRLVGGWEHYAGLEELDELDYRILRELYEAEVAMVDRLVGQLIDGLRERGQIDSTLVVITSDHGENIGEHGLLDHILSLHETTLHVPLLIRYPGLFEGGRVDNRLTSLIDLYPTILEVAGLSKVDPAVEGVSLLDVDSEGHQYVVAENDRPVRGVANLRILVPSFDVSRADRRMRMIRTDRYKLIWYEGGQVELYDLAGDPGELVDISETLPGVRDEMLASLLAWMDTRTQREQPTAYDSADEKEKHELRALGYIE